MQIKKRCAKEWVTAGRDCDSSRKTPMHLHEARDNDLKKKNSRAIKGCLMWYYGTCILIG